MQPRHGPCLPTISQRIVTMAVVLGRSGTVGSDVLAPYEVFASSPTFSVYTVAESAEPAPIASAPRCCRRRPSPTSDAGRAASPDVVVVPAVPRRPRMRGR
jgi:hypothetical protein